MKMRYLLVILCLAFMIGCGSSGSSGSSDLSCAPATDDLVDPTVDLNGTWTLYLTETSSTCTYPPTYISCSLTFSVSGNNVSISGSCVDGSGSTVSISSTQGIISGDTFYWGATMSGSADGYTETDTVSCTSVDFTSSGTDEFSVTAAVEWSYDGDSGSCSTTFTGQFY